LVFEKFETFLISSVKCAFFCWLTDWFIVSRRRWWWIMFLGRSSGFIEKFCFRLIAEPELSGRAL
jgi:hypothetical protein